MTQPVGPIVDPLPPFETGEDPLIVGQLIRDDPQDNFSQTQKSNDYYPESAVDVRYEFHPGTAALAVAGPDGTPLDIIKLHAGYWTKVVDWSYQRNNLWPQCPSPFPLEEGLELIYASPVVAVPYDAMEGRRIFRVSGTYIYAIREPLEEFGPFESAGVPSSAFTQSENILPAENFIQGQLP